MTKLLRFIGLIPLAIALLFIAFLFVLASVLSVVLHSGLEWLMSKIHK